MSVINELHAAKKISWGSIIGGVITVLAVSLLLSTLGTSLGFSIVDPLADEPVNGVGTTVLVWSAISIIISLAAGAFIAGRLAAMDGLIHGFLVWATALIVAAVFGTALLGGAMKATGSALGSVASLTGNAISGMGSVVGGGLQGLADMGGQALDNLNLDTKLQPEAVSNDVAAALRKSNIASLQPDYMQTQLEGAKTEIGEAVKAIAVNPQNSDEIIQTLTDKLKKRGDALSKDVDRDSVTKALSENSSMTQEEVNKTVDNLIEARNQTVQVVNQRLNDVEANIEQAKQQYTELKQKAREEAATAASALAHAALWSFFALLIGAVVSALSGLWGVKTGNKHFAAK